MKQASIFVIVIVALAVFLGFALGSPLLVLTAKTDTKSFCDTGDTDYYGAGQYPEDELLSTDKDWLSWAHDGTGIPFSVGGKYKRCAGAWYANSYGNRYVFEANLGDGFKGFAQDDFPNGYIQPPNADQGILIKGEGGWSRAVDAREIRIDGTTLRWLDGKEETIPDGAILRVMLQVEYRHIFQAPTWGTIAQDELVLRYGTPLLTRGAEIYEVGETWEFRWSGLPFTQTEEGATAYYLTVTDLNTNAPVPGWDYRPLGARSGIASGPVTTAMFKPGGANAIRASLYSPVFQAGVTDTSVIDDKDLAPTLDSLEWNQPEFREGDVITVTYSASPNPSTESPIARYHVLINVDGDILYDQDTQGTSVSVTASRTGNVYAEVRAYDDEGRPSATRQIQATVGNVVDICEVKPELAQCTGASGLAGLIAIIVAAIVLLVGLSIGTKLGKSNIYVFLAFLGFAGLAAIFVYFAVRGAL